MGTIKAVDTGNILDELGKSLLSPHLSKGFPRVNSVRSASSVRSRIWPIAALRYLTIIIVAPLERLISSPTT